MAGKMKVMLISIAVMVILLLQNAEGRYRFEVRVLKYRNPNNQDYNGGCCDPSFSCSNPCDIIFYACLRNYQHSPRTSDLPCSYGTVATGSVGLAETTTFNLGQSIGGQSNPFVYTGNTWPGRFQLMVRMFDADSPDSDDLVDRVIVDRSLSPSSSFSSVVPYSGYYGKVTLDLSFRVRCDTNYYGSNCATYCVPEDSDTQGHFTCNAQGSRVCAPGYTGQDCLTPVCQNGCVNGRCSRPGLCDICNSGWSGSLCTDCELAAGCPSGRAYCREPGQCICNFGYSGTLCQNDDDVCGHQSPCRNGGTCSNAGSNAHTCTCPANLYTGLNCEEEINHCDPSPCRNGGECQRVLGSFTCSCAPGWTGTTCGDNIDECAVVDTPCQNGGNCSDCVPTTAAGSVEVVQPGTTSGGIPINSNNNTCPNGFTCTCPMGWYGDRCEVDIDYCVSAPCQNNASCHDIHEGPGYSCLCLGGFTGVNCETEIDECEANPCMNGATCLDHLNGFSCMCVQGFTGPQCQENIDDCSPSPCNNLTSLGCEDMVDGYHCQCLPGYTGTNCESEVDECASSPCLNGGKCTDLFNDFSCECASGFIGITCSINVDDCHPDFCLFGGTCMDQVDGYTCECTPDRSGRQCEVEIDPCDHKPCEKDFVCIRASESLSGYNCTHCVETEAGCPAAQQGDGGSDSGLISGGVIGGVAAALLLLILLIVCCCCRKRCCCCCGETIKEEEVEIESQDKSQNNPLYFGVSTILSSGGGSLRPKPHPDHTYTDLTRMAELELSSSTTAMVSSKYGTLVTPPISPAPGAATTTTEPHYEQIPAAQNGGLTGNHYQLLDKPPPLPAPPSSPSKKGSPKKKESPLFQKSGQYDKLEERGRGKENPYVSSPTRGHRDMYTLLPSSEQLKEMADSYDSDTY